MTPHPPPRFATAVLNHLADRNEALAGDLLEGYRSKQSRLWFWRQLLTAIVNGSFPKPDEIRPLKLVEHPSALAPLPDFAAKRLQLQTLLSGSPVSGIGGIGIVAVVVLITLVQPLMWWLVALGLVGGVALGVARVMLAKRKPEAPRAPLVLRLR